MPVTELTDILLPPGLHVPPGTVSISVVEEPTQTGREPLMSEGSAFTVTIFAIAQPVYNV
jgi:hypothetical protein